MTVREYEVMIDNLASSVRIACIADLHGKQFGEGNSRLIAKVEAQESDAIFVVGNMIGLDATAEETDRFIVWAVSKLRLGRNGGRHMIWGTLNWKTGKKLVIPSGLSGYKYVPRIFYLLEVCVITLSKYNHIIGKKEKLIVDIYQIK